MRIVRAFEVMAQHPLSIRESRGVAVVQAWDRPGDFGYGLIRTLVEENYKGRIVPVNPAAEPVFGIQSCRSLTDVPRDVTEAVISVPDCQLESVLDRCVQLSIRVVAISFEHRMQPPEKPAEVEEHRAPALSA